MPNKDLSIFQKNFEKYQRRFGLTGYRVYFKHEPLEETFAEITISHTDKVVTARLNSALPAKDKPFKNIRRSAKHEAIHLLLGKLEGLAQRRCIRDEEIYEATEELVFKLEELIEG